MALVIEDLTVRFGSVIAVQNVDLRVPKGETLGLLGPSGCGKSTLLRAVAGLEPAERGRISFDGRNLSGVATHQRDVGLMFQSHALFPHRTVSGNVGFGLRMRGDDPARQRARVAEMLELVGLPGYATRRIDTLSGGESQRVALARALAPQPSVLLLDEPLGSLDRLLRERLADELRVLLQELRQTAILVTHDHEEASTVADHLAVMNSAEILVAGTRADVLANPGSEIAAGLLGVAGDGEAKRPT